jgi:DNA-binding GntR family transcriptional regulator
LVGDKSKLGAVELAYRSIRADIVSGVLAGGERLTEESLSRDLGLSRTPIREAIRPLTLEGFVSPQDGYTTRVADFTEDERKQAFDFRQMLEACAFERPAVQATREDIDETARHSETISRHTPPETQDDYVRIAEANGLFHRKVVEMARSPRLTALMSIAFDVGTVARTCRRYSAEELQRSAGPARRDHGCIACKVVEVGRVRHAHANSGGTSRCRQVGECR